MKKFFSSLSLTTKLFCLIVLPLATANCDCGNQVASDDNKNKAPIPKQRTERPQTEEVPTDKQIDVHQPDLLLTGENEVVDNEWISFTLKNQDNQSLDLSGIKVVITLYNTQNFNDQEIKEGQVVVYSSLKSKLAQEREITLSLTDLLEIDRLEPGKDQEILLELVDIDNLANAKITFQINDQQNNLLQEATTSWKVTNKIGPLPGKSRVEITPDFTRLELQQSTLRLPIQFKNLSDHPIDLKRADYQLIITDQKGKEVLNEVCPGENVRMQRAILPKETDLELFLQIPKIKNRGFAEGLMKNNLRCQFISLTKADKEKIAEYDQPLYFKVGPMSGQSNITIEILDRLSKLEENQGKLRLGFQAKITNQSNHPINPKAAVYRYKLTLKDGTILANDSLKGDELLNDDDHLIPACAQSKNKGVSYTLPFIPVTLASYNKQQIQNWINAGEITFELEMLTLDGVYLLGKYTRI
jgi:hypothetical protein